MNKATTAITDNDAHLTPEKKRQLRRHARSSRILDLLLGIPAFLLTLPIQIIFAAVLIHDVGRPLFFQTRVGRDGEPFTMVKFHSLTCNSKDPVKNHLQYTTPFTRFLRRWGLDELPELWNVITGDMSLVGPRPVMPSQVDEFTPEAWEIIHAVKPGLTGYFQVMRRHKYRTKDKLKYDLIYVEKKSFFFDLLIILRTVPSIILRGKKHMK
ncbi:MAG: sugar transferase [Candidatus Coatesbacteria bacterium]|nr:sugar transferase [Candidatus Coatesbacteria bacterium]